MLASGIHTLSSPIFAGLHPEASDDCSVEVDLMRQVEFSVVV